ncbi:MAG: hypothetical protein DMG70_16080 [Acidobacteria bacterium]|nr:MAG: hypothetical protein DMG70_16080 [Acidobacteriota bacterium]PYY07473.1 MAG: hypothetical protein DMG69_19440 [Acidobacteriota bacterium]
MNASPYSNHLPTEWRNALCLYPLYLALAQEFVIELPASPELESGTDAPSQDCVQQARQWFNTMDERIQVHQLRQFLQTTPLADNEIVRLMLLRHLGKEQRTPADRDKIDFLLVQFFSLSTPSRLDDSDCELDYVAEILRPVLGAVETVLSDWLSELEPMIQSASGCRRLSELFTRKILEQGRKLKVEAKEKYFEPVAMVAFTRFSFLMRRVFFRLMHEDLNAILDGLRQLESHGITTLDCRRAHFSHQEPTDRLRMICHSWKVMFHAEYSSGQPLKMLADLRTVVEEVLARCSEPANPAAPATLAGSSERPKARAAAATSVASSSAAPEFEVATSQPAHDEGDGI